MLNARTVRFLLISLVLLFSCARTMSGAKNMEQCEPPCPLKEVEFKDPIVSIFPVGLENAFGMIAGKPDHETLRIGFIEGQQFKEKVFNRKGFEPAEEIGYCYRDCNEMLMAGHRILRWINWELKKEEIVYWGVGDVLENEYLKTKLIDTEKKIVLTAFCPLYDENYERINYTWCLTHEDLINKKRIKSIPINTLSGAYKTNTRSDLSPNPDVFFGPDYVIYRESPEYPWLCVNNNLDSIDHLLKDALNQNTLFFATDFVSLEISSTMPYAVAVCKEPLSGKRTVAMVQWNKAPAVMPIELKFSKNEEVDNKSLQLSPSGSWAYFTTFDRSERRHFLLYIDPDLPGGCLPPFELNTTGFDNKATWITKPEGFVMQVGGKMFYWDLSKFKVGEFLTK
jgi:hypothetical protein